MPTTYDMTGTTRREIRRCLHWLHRDRRSGGNGHRRLISVVIGRGIRTKAWGDELEIRDPKTNHLRLPRWWERTKHGGKQRLFSFQRFCPLVVQHVYCHGGEYDIELQPHSNRDISSQVLLFGNSRRESRWFIQAIRIHDVGARNADAAPPSAIRAMGGAIAAFTAVAADASARVAGWQAGFQTFANRISGEEVPANRGVASCNGDDCSDDDWAADCYDDCDDECDVAETACASPYSQNIPVRASLDIDDAEPYRLGTSRYDPPVIIDQTNSVCDWIEQATTSQRRAFAEVNGDAEEVRVFFANLVRDALRDGGLIESSGRRVHARNTNAIIGYNLSSEIGASSTGCLHFSLDLICGYRWTFWVDDSSQITTPGNIPSDPPTSPTCTPPIVISSVDSVHAWLEQATCELQAEFTHVNGNARAVELFFAGLAEAALDDGGWVEEPDRRVYSTRNELVGYNLTIEGRQEHLRQYYVSMDMIDGSRRVFTLDSLSRISTPNFPQATPCPNMDMSRFRSAFGLPVAQGDMQNSQLLQDEIDRQINRQRSAVRPGPPLPQTDRQPSPQPVRPPLRRTRVERDNQYRVAYGGGPAARRPPANSPARAFEVEMQGNWNRCDT